METDVPLTVRQATAILGVSPGKVYLLCSGKKIRHLRIVRDKRPMIRIERSAIDAYLKSVTVEPEPEAEPVPESEPEPAVRTLNGRVVPDVMARIAARKAARGKPPVVSE